MASLSRLLEGVPVVAQWLANLTRIHENVGLILALLSGLKIWCCHELWCMSQMQLGSGVAVAVVQASGQNSDLTASLGTSMCHGRGPKKKTKKKDYWKSLWAEETKLANKSEEYYLQFKYLFALKCPLGNSRGFEKAR